jgi:two-component system, OmpR family, alkaline phosphatase synthesis response regulator PhoP
MMNKILLVDDEKDIVEFLQYNLKQEGFEVIIAYDGIEAMAKLSENPDLIILDIMMPRMDGFEVCRRIREMKEYKNIPIIFLTARSSEKDEVEGLETGAGDYISKPISPTKLIARVNSNLRKNYPQHDKPLPQKINIGPVYIDRDKYVVYVDGSEKIMPRKEFEILYYLANNPGRVISRGTLLKEIWGNDVLVVDRTVDVHIRKIREKLESHFDLIETIKGVGYRFKSVE